MQVLTPSILISSPHHELPIMDKWYHGWAERHTQSLACRDLSRRGARSSGRRKFASRIRPGKTRILRFCDRGMIAKVD